MNLRRRIRTGLSAIAVLSACLLSPLSSAALAAICAAVCADEYLMCTAPLSHALRVASAKHTPISPPSTRTRRVNAALAAMVMAVTFAYGERGLWLGLLACFVWLSSVALLSALDTPVQPADVVGLAVQLLGLVYVAGGLGHAVLFLSARDGLAPLSVVFVAVVAGENGALAAGLVCGSRRVTPHLSAQKTLEGFVAQVVTSVLAVLGLDALAVAIFSGELLPYSTAWLAVCGAMLGVAGIAGDLFESWIKRACKVKDMGKLLPGTGGVMDRVDGLLFAFPAMYVFHGWQITQ